ncbi:MAG: TonB-dependent receptor [Erythrobacter sp.]
MNIARCFGATATAVAALAIAFPAMAQDANETGEAQDGTAADADTDQGISEGEIVVTGSFIRRTDQADLASPLTTVGSESISEIGAQNIADITQSLTINTGAQNNVDQFRAGGTIGTSNINLRGLGLQSTLVLVNGHRQVLNGNQTSEGISFVDTNALLPLIAIDRLEVLTDGAAALYGSDAVAGVANFITVTNYDGIKLSGDFQFHTPGGQSQEDFRIEGLVGKTFDRGSVLVAASYVNRSSLTTAERRLSPLFGPDGSALGNPGAFIVPDFIGAGLVVPGPPPAVLDPSGCAEFGGNPIINIPLMNGFTQGLCQFDFGGFFDLVPETERINIYAEASYDITDSITASIDFSYAENQSSTNGSPTFPFLFNAVIPGDAPTNVISDAVGTPTTAIFFGRAVGNDGAASTSTTDSQTDRFHFKLQSDNFLNNGFWEVSYTRARNEFVLTTPDTVTDRFQCALAGLQGTTGINPSTGFANCDTFIGLDGAIPVGEFFNPFATSFTTLPNSTAILDFIIADRIIESNSSLDVIDAVFGTELFDLPVGPVSIAAGFQYRDEGLSQTPDAISAVDGFGFLIGSQPFSDSIDVYAFFGEIDVPVTEWLDLQAAIRFEDFGSAGGSTVDPKIALLARPIDRLSLRATFSTSFRAPTVFQQFGQSTTLSNIVDPGLDGVIGTADDGGTAFGAVRAFGSAVAGVPLSPESSTAFTAGLTFEPIDDLVIDLDYYNFAFEDAITQVGFQSLVNANPIDTRTFVGGVPQEACTAEFTVVCRSGDPVTGIITTVNTNFTNAEAIDTDGIDIKLRYTIDAGRWGIFQPNFQGTWILNYDIIDPVAGAVDASGSRNFTNIGSPTPDVRWNAGLGYRNGPFSLDFFARHVGELDDDQTPGNVVESQTRYDLQVGLDIGEWVRTEGAIFTIGVINLTDELPPLVNTNGGFETRVHDPRGRLIRFGLDLEF